MRKAAPFKNRKAIKLYALIAIVLITVFQGYWLHSVFEEQKSIALREAENILKKTVLEMDHSDIKQQLLHSEIPKTSDMDEFTRQLFNTLKNNKNVKVSVSMEGGRTFDDSLSGKLLDRLSEPVSAVDSTRSKRTYFALKPELRMQVGNIPFQIVHTLGEHVNPYPKVFESADAETDEIRSENDGKNFYQVRFRNMNGTILAQMWGPITLSLFYTLICIGAVFLLLGNVNKSRRLMRQKDNFTNNMTHEFKTPMATIYAAIEALQTYDVLDDRQMTNEYLGMMKNDLNRLMNMTDSILLNAKVNDGTIILDVQKVEIPGFIASVVQQMRPVLDKKNATVSMQFDKNQLFAMADKEHLGNVFRNLLDNSIKYSRGPARITIAVAAEEGAIRIRFSDEGIGIPEKYRREIFQPYFRVQENDVHTVKGYGLGLSYIKQIIGMHHGKIELAQHDGPGAAFEIVIPAIHE